MHTCLLEKETLENKDCIVIDCCYLFLGSHTKNEKNKKNIYQKIFGRNPKNNRSEKMMLECP